MTTTASKHFVIRKRLAISFLIVAFIVILLGLLGYFWLPGYAKSRIETILSDTLLRPVTIQSIDIHLYSLEMTVNGFHVGEKVNHADTNKTFFYFEKLHADLSIKSVTQRAPVISAITVSAPRLRLVREGENQFNISDLIHAFVQSDDAEEDHETKFSVSNIVIHDGNFELIDRYKQSHQKVSDIELSVPFIANFASTQTAWVEPYFSAKFNGSPFLLDGKLRLFTDKREATLELKLNGIDLTNIDEYSPIPTGIRLLSGYFDSDLQIKFSQFIDEPPRITLSGKTLFRQVAVNNQAVEMPHQAKLDILFVQLKEIDLTGQKPSNAAIALRNFALIREDDTIPFLSLSKLMAKNIQIDKGQQQVELDELLLDRFHASIRREQGGDIDLTRLFSVISPTASASETLSQEKNAFFPIPAHKPPIPVAKIQRAWIPFPGKKPLVAANAKDAAKEKTIEAASSQIAKPAVTSDSRWAAQLNLLKLTASSLHFADMALPDLPPMEVDSLDLTLTDIDLTGKNPLNMVLQAKINQRGSIDTKGSFAWAPLTTDLDVDLKAVDLVSLQGWAVDQLNAILTRGALSFQGKIKASGEPLKVSLEGDGQFLDFNVFDKANASDLLSWKKMDVNDINAVNDPLRVDISTIKLDNFFARLIILPEGDLNLTKIVQQDKEAASTFAAQQTTTRPAAAETPSVNIDEVILQHGNVKFNDRFVEPNYRANLTGLSGNIGPVHPDKTISIDIHGEVDRSAPLEIIGNFNPYGNDLQLDIKAKARNIEMPALSPYTGKLVGYSIEKGKLSVDIHYHIEEGALKAENNVFLDQLDIGEQVDSPDAPSLPLRLAVTLLKNRQGEIDINLPIQGSVNDPQFSLGGIIFDAFINLITKAITSPFELLGSVLEDGEELSTIHFLAGEANIGTEAEKRLQALSRILTERTSLELEITGYADLSQDYEGLKKVILERKIKALKLTEDAQKGIAGGSLEDVTLAPEEYEKYLTFIYEEEDFEKPTNFFGFTKSLSVPEMEQLILSHLEINEEQMQALAEQRANAARSWLIEQGGIANERIFVLGGKIASQRQGETRGSRVEFSLM